MGSQNNNRIDYIEFGATDIPATKEFFTAVFGWKFTDYGPDYVSFEDGRIAGGFDKAARVGKASPLVVLYSSELEKTQSTVLKHGGKVVKEIFSFPGGRRFHFTDPNGNELAAWSDR